MFLTMQRLRRHCLVVLTGWLWLGASPADRSSHAADRKPTANTVKWPALKPFNEKATWPAPTLGDDNYRKWLTFIRPTEKELKWKKIRWHKSLSIAADEARRLKRPILLWTMNGHPCGET